LLFGQAGSPSRHARLVKSRPTGPETPLRCPECGAVSDQEARAWRAYLDDEFQAATFCLDCAELDFGLRPEA